MNTLKSPGVFIVSGLGVRFAGSSHLSLMVRLYADSTAYLPDVKTVLNTALCVEAALNGFEVAVVVAFKFEEDGISH